MRLMGLSQFPLETHHIFKSIPAAGAAPCRGGLQEAQLLGTPSRRGGRPACGQSQGSQSQDHLPPGGPPAAPVGEGGAVKCLNRLEQELRFKIRTREMRKLGLGEEKWWPGPCRHWATRTNSH